MSSVSDQVALVDHAHTAALISEQQSRAIDALRRCVTPAGLKASGRTYGHHQVWTRDSMITLLGASLTGDEAICAALERSISTLAAHQTRTGEIPNNVDAESGKVNFRAYADAGLWFVIGSAILKPDLDAIRRVLRWYECQDVEQNGLISIQESSDWQDLFAVRGKALCVNCLYALALSKAAGIASGEERREWLECAGRVREAINRLLWYNGHGDPERRFAHTFSTDAQQTDSLGRRRRLPRKRILQEESYYLPCLRFRGAGEWFDMLGNLLAILAGIADDDQTRKILGFIGRYGLADGPAKSIYPPILPGEADGREYYGDLNLPHQYHNGGVWPFLGGFYVATLVKAGEMGKAREALGRLATLTRQGEFNEWHHGVTLEPMGVADQAWSAGMYLYACECVRRGAVVYL
jgi:hypothetical protein